MRKAVRELALAIGGFGLGIVLFIAASAHIYSFGQSNFILMPLPYESWGYPLPWLFQIGSVYRPPTVLAFGLSVDGAVTWSAFYEDLAFWLTLPIAAIELSMHIAVPYTIRAVKLRRGKRGTASAYGFLESPDRSQQMAYSDPERQTRGGF